MCKYQIEYGYGAPIEAFVEKAVIIVIMVLDLRKGTLSFALKMSGERAKAQDQGVTVRCIKSMSVFCILET